MSRRFAIRYRVLVFIFLLGLSLLPPAVTAQQIQPTSPAEEEDASGHAPGHAPGRASGPLAIEFSMVSTFALYEFNQPANAFELLANVFAYLQGLRGGGYFTVEIRPAPSAGIGLEVGALGMILETTVNGTTITTAAFDLPMRFRVASELGPVLLRTYTGVNLTGLYYQNSGDLLLGVLAEAGIRVGLGPFVAEYSRLFGPDEDRGSTFGDHSRLGLGLSLQL